MEKEAAAKEEEIVVDEEHEEELEAYEDLIIGIDNILNYDLEDKFYYNNYDFFFFFFTLFLLIFNGFFFLSFFYMSFGVHMVVQYDYDEEEDASMERGLEMTNIIYRAFNILEDLEKKKCIDLDATEHLKFSNNCLFKANTILSNKQLNFMKAPILNKYNIFLKIYFDIYHFKNIKYSISNKLFLEYNKNNLFHLNDILKKDTYLKYINNYQKENYFIFDNIYLTEYEYILLLKDIQYSYICYKNYNKTIEYYIV
jgi:hypothetical protein